MPTFGARPHLRKKVAGDRAEEGKEQLLLVSVLLYYNLWKQSAGESLWDYKLTSWGIWSVPEQWHSHGPKSALQ